MTHHLVHGLHVSSPVPLAAGPADGNTLDVRIERAPGPVRPPRGRVLAAVDEGPGRRRHALVATEDAHVLHLLDAATLAFRTGGGVELRVEPSLPDDLLPVLLGGPGTVVAALLAGHRLMHASAVLLPDLGGAVAVMGPPGSGKSTVARLLAGSSRPLLSDDAVRLDVDEHACTVVVHRGTTATRLRGRADELARLGGGRMRVAGDGRSVLESAVIAPPVAPLGVIALPRLSPGVDRVSATPLPRAAALPLLASACPLDGVRDPGLLRRQFTLAAAVVGAVPVVELRVPWTPGALDPSLPEQLLTALVDAAAPVPVPA